MGNGLPLAATTASKALVDGFRAKNDYFNTCSASPLQAAVGLAVLDEIERGKLVDNAANIGAKLKSELDKRKEDCAFIGDVRAQGLFLVVEMIKDEATKTADAACASVISNRLKDKGFLTCTDGAYSNVVKIRPPLVFSDQHADEFLVAFDDVLSEINE
jgi:4-aminobutyrate aminotransferase-like enzyme